MNLCSDNRPCLSLQLLIDPSHLLGLQWHTTPDVVLTADSNVVDLRRSAVEQLLDLHLCATIYEEATSWPAQTIIKKSGAYPGTARYEPVLRIEARTPREEGDFRWTLMLTSPH